MANTEGKEHELGKVTFKVTGPDKYRGKVTPMQPRQMGTRYKVPCRAIIVWPNGYVAHNTQWNGQAWDMKDVKVWLQGRIDESAVGRMFSGQLSEWVMSGRRPMYTITDILDEKNQPVGEYTDDTAPTPEIPPAPPLAPPPPQAPPPPLASRYSPGVRKRAAVLLWREAFDEYKDIKNEVARGDMAGRLAMTWIREYDLTSAFCEKALRGHAAAKSTAPQVRERSGTGGPPAATTTRPSVAPEVRPKAPTPRPSPYENTTTDDFPADEDIPNGMTREPQTDAEFSEEHGVGPNEDVPF